MAMRRASWRSTNRPIEVAGIFALAIGALYLGQGIFVPLVLSVLVAFALNPLVLWFQRFGIPHLFAVLLTVVLVAGMVIALAFVTSDQLLKLAADLPQYQATVANKLRVLQGGGEESALGKLSKAVDELGNQVSPDTAGASSRPIPVEISNVPPSPFDGITGWLGAALGPLATAALVTIFSIFLLLERVDLRDRFIKLVSRGDLRTSTKVMDESAGRVSRYLLVQLTVNTGFGVLFGGGMYALGVPNAILWGLLSIVFRYIPFIGTLLAVLLPAALAFAIDPGWTMLLGVVGIYVLLEVITTNAIEPRLYGSTTGISALAVLVAAIFWATLWGPVGLVLATPITVCLVVLGRYVPQLAFLDTLLGSEPVLLPEERLYQRLLAGNVAEALELSESELVERDVPGFFDRIAIPALRLAESDLNLDATDLVRRRNVVDTINGVIDELDTAEQEPDPASASVLVIGGKTELDGASAAMLARALAVAGIATRQLPPMSVGREGIGQLDTTAIQVVCVCYLGSNPHPYLRYAAARLHRKDRAIKVVACLFGSDQLPAPVDTSSIRAERVAHSIAEAVKVTSDILAELAGGERNAADPAVTVERLRRAAAQGDWIEQASKAIAERLSVPLALARLNSDQDESLLTQHVARATEPVVISNTDLETEVLDDVVLVENGFKSYLGVRLATSSGETVGTLSIYDVVPHDFDKDVDRLVAEASRLMDDLERRASGLGSTEQQTRLAVVA